MSLSGGFSSGWLRQVRKAQVWCAFLSLSLALSVATALQRGRTLVDQVDRFRLPDRALNPSLADGFSPPADDPSTGLFTLALLLGFTLSFLSLSMFNAWLDRRLDAEAVAGERSGLLLLSQIALGLYGLHLMVGEAVPESMRGGVHLLASLLLVSMLAKRLVAVRLSENKEWAGVWGMLGDNQFMLASLFFPVVLIGLFDGLSRGVLEPLGFLSDVRGFVDYLIVLLLLLLGYALVVRRRASAGGSLALVIYDLNTAVLVAAAPLLLIPLGFQIVNELQFTFGATGSRWPYLFMSALLFGVALILFAMQRRGRLHLTGAGVLAIFYYPVAVATLASFKSHRHTVKLSEVDYFRLGEQVLPTQQWFDFGSFPLLDLIPARGFSDVGIQSLYSLLNGIQGLDMLVWLPWIPVVVGFVSIYSLLAVVVSPLVAFLVTILLPVSAAAAGPYALALAPAFLLVLALRRPSFSSLLVLWLGAILLIVWRPQLGWPVLIAALIVIGAAAAWERRELLSPAIASLGLLVFAVPVALVVADIFGSADTLDTMRALIGSADDAATRGLGGFVINRSGLKLAGFLEGALPIVAIVGLVVYVIKRVVGKVSFSASSHAVLYLAVFSLLMPVRLEMLGKAHLLDPSLHLLMLALLPFLLLPMSYRSWMTGRTSWLIVTLVFCTLMGSVAFFHLTGETVVHRVRDWQPDERRVLFDEKPHRELVEVLHQELKAGETFLDFTNSPLIYSLAGVRFPFQEILDFRITSESRQRAQLGALQAYREKHGLPLVVLQAPPSVAKPDRRVAVATTSYRIAEYLYSEYLPFATVSGWQLWRERGVRRSNPVPPARITSPSSVSQHFWLGSLPYRWAKGDPYQADRQTDLIESLLEEPTVIRSGVSLSLPWESRVVAIEGNYLQIRARSLPDLALRRGAPTEANLTLIYGEPKQSSFVLTLAPQSDREGISEQKIKLPLREDPKLNRVELLTADPDRLVFQAGSGDPWVRRFVDPSATRKLDPGEELWLHLRYRSSRRGNGQIYFASGKRQFQESASVQAPMMALRDREKVEELLVPVVGVEAGQKLVDVRLDPPDGAEFEIVSVDLIRRQREFNDYLIRLSTQWRWFSGEIQSLTLQSDSPVLIDSVYLRSGD